MKVSSAPGRASFEPYAERVPGGGVAHANQLLGRAWPPYRPARHTVPAPVRKPSWRTQRVLTGIQHGACLAAAYRWLPCNPLLVHLMRTEDAARSAGHR